MIDFKEALKIIGGQVFVPDTERVDLRDAPGRILAEDIISDIDMPPFDRSAMDGFACRRSDLGDRLEIIESIKAGDVPRMRIGRNQCTRIMTGGKVPDGADCVIMVEHTLPEDDRHIRFAGSKTAGNIAFKGEDLKKGDLVLAKGTLLRPGHIAILAAAGSGKPAVFRQPRVAVLTTGDEIVEPDTLPGGTSIRNSNGPSLVAQISVIGALPDYRGIIEDDPSATASAISEALSSCDAILITGGVSMGDYDFVPEVLRSCGIELFFEKVAIKPGRPTVFGKKGNIPVFGLPGNPVSAFIIFELMVKPLLFQMMGHKYDPPAISLPMGRDYSRKKADRVSFIPVSLNSRGEVIPAEYHGSGHIHSLAGAWGLMGMETGVYSIKKGERVNVRQI